MNVQVAFKAPHGATDLKATASWDKTHNVMASSQEVKIAGVSAVAAGKIRGLNKSFQSCYQGGGDGELVLRGTYKIVVNPVKEH